MPATPKDSGALSLRSWALEAEAAADIAKALAPTAFVPDQLRVWVEPRGTEPGQAGTRTTRPPSPKSTAVLLAGQELDMGPMAALRSITIIRGQVALFALAARALLQRRGHEIIVDGVQLHAGRRPGPPVQQ